MSIEQWTALFEASGVWAGSILVVVQLRTNNRQQQAQGLLEIYNLHQDLLALGFDHPQLFLVLADEPTDETLQRRYLQLWLNFFAMIHSYVRASVFRGELKDSLLRDLSDFFGNKNMRKDWEKYGVFYPDSFQILVNETIQKIRLKERAAAEATAAQAKG